MLKPKFQKRHVLLAIACVALTCQVNAVQAQTQALQWKLAKGDQFQFQIDQTTAVETDVDRRKVPQKNTMKMQVQWEVQSVNDDGSAVVQQTISHIALQLINSGTDPIDYDSGEEKIKGAVKQRIHKSFSKIINQPIMVTLSKAGEITEVEIPEATLEQLRQMPGSIQGRQMFQVESLNEMFSQAGLGWSEQAGSTWETTRDFSLGVPQPFSQTTTYEFVDSDTDLLEIKFTSKIETTGEPKQDTKTPIDFENLEITKQDSSGTIMFDSQAGNCTSSSSKSTLETRATYRDKEIRTTINSELKMTVTRK